VIAPLTKHGGPTGTIEQSSTSVTKRVVVFVFLAGVVAGTAALYVVGWQLSRPVPAHVGPPPPQLQARPISFASKSGWLIHGWLSRGTVGHGVVLLLPGVRANRLAMVDRALALRARGYSTLLIDFQATGESEGNAITFGWRERLDVIAAVQLIRDTLRGERIGIIGVSLGGAAALLAAPSLDIDAAVFEAVYPSIEVAIENRLRLRLGSLGAALSPLLLVQLGPRLGVSPSNLKPLERIAELRCPVLIVGGIDDRHTTVADTQQLFAAAREPKALWLIPGAAHVDYYRASPEEYEERVFGFLDSSLRTHVMLPVSGGTSP
jgi:fermentation-respiration switch protein FrsA (DUF1100 family)